MKKEKTVSKQQFDTFMKEIRKLNLSNTCLIVLNAIISIGSGNIFTQQMLSKKINFSATTVSKVTITLATLEVIKRERVFENHKFIGMRITVNFDFKSAAQTDKDLSPLTEAEQEKDPIRGDLLNNAQMAAILGIRVDTVTRKIKQGQIPKHNVVINQRLKFWSRDFIKGFLNLE